jgi:hypothetical protein
MLSLGKDDIGNLTLFDIFHIDTLVFARIDAEIERKKKYYEKYKDDKFLQILSGNTHIRGKVITVKPDKPNSLLKTHQINMYNNDVEQSSEMLSMPQRTIADLFPDES